MAGGFAVDPKYGEPKAAKMVYIESKPEIAMNLSRSQPDAPAPVPAPSAPKAWHVAVVRMLCCMLSRIDRQVLSLRVPQIKAGLGINDTRVGLLQGFSFAIFNAAMRLPLGRIADLTNRRNPIAVFVGGQTNTRRRS